jgi:hypothetical protein
MKNVDLVGMIIGVGSIYAGFDFKNLKNFKEKCHYIINISLNYHVSTLFSYEDLF